MFNNKRNWDCSFVVKCKVLNWYIGIIYIYIFWVESVIKIIEKCKEYEIKVLLLIGVIFYSFFM